MNLHEPDVFEYLMAPLCAQIQFTKVTKLSQNVRKLGINIPELLSKMVIIIRPIARIFRRRVT